VLAVSDNQIAQLQSPSFEFNGVITEGAAV
jgi:hypothetical protein